MKEYIFYQVGVIVLYSSFQQNNFTLFLPPTTAFDTLMTVAEFSDFPSNSLVKVIFYCNHKPRSVCVRTKHM